MGWLCCLRNLLPASCPSDLHVVPKKQNIVFKVRSNIPKCAVGAYQFLPAGASAVDHLCLMESHHEHEEFLIPALRMCYIAGTSWLPEAAHSIPTEGPEMGTLRQARDTPILDSPTHLQYSFHHMTKTTSFFPVIRK